MKKDFIKFILRFSLFVLILFFLVLSVNCVYAHFVIMKQQYYRQNLSYEKYIKELPTPKKINYAFFGDSHTRNDVNPQFFPRSFNFGTSAENYIETYYKLKKIIYLDKIKIDTAFFEIDLNTFSTLMTDETRLFDDVNYFSKFMSYNEIKSIKNVSNIQMIKTYLSDVYFSSIGKGEDFINIFIQPKLTEVHLGWTKEYEDFTKTDTKKITLKTYEKQFGNQERISKISLGYFLKTLDLARENGINIVFVKYPTSKELDDVMIEKGLDKDGYYKIIFNEIDKKLDKKYLVLDYYNLFFDHSDYFTNADHLNYKGADILSKKIKEDLKNKITQYE